jgi:HEAT repeat protein
VTRRRKGEKTAAELAAELAADDQFQREQRERARRRDEEIEANRVASEPLVSKLRAMGFDVEFVGDLYDQGFDYRTAVPLLAESLSSVDNEDVKRDIVRALSVPWAREEPNIVPLLIDEFRSTTDPQTRWAIANALEVLADDAHFEAVASLVTDPESGDARQMLTLALAKMEHPDRDALLRRLLDDPLVAGHAVMAIGKAGAVQLSSDIQRFLEHERAWIRVEARKALSHLTRAKSGTTDPGGAEDRPED